MEVYRSHAPTIEMLADARAWLDRLAPQVALAVVTDGPLTSQHARAEALQLSRWADVIVFTETLGSGRGKPHPAAFEQLEREVGLRGDRCAYVADNPAKDFVSPHRLGWRTVRVRRRGSLHANFPSGGDIDAEVTSLDNLDTALAWDDSPTSNHIMKLPRSRISCGLATAPWDEVRSASSGGMSPAKRAKKEKATSVAATLM